MSRVDLLLKQYKPITREQAPHLFECVEKLAKKAGVGTINLHWYEGDHPMLHNLIAAVKKTGKDGNPNIVLGHKISGHLDFAKLEHTISPEMEAVLAHEIGHVKHDLGALGGLNMSRLSPLAGMMAGLVAMACIRHYNKSHAEQKKDPYHDDLKLINEQGELHLPEKGERKTAVDTLITMGKYLAAAVVGLGVGTYGFKLIRHRIEYRADKFSAQLLADAKPMQNALRKLGDFIKTEQAVFFSELPADKAAKAKKGIEILESFLHPPIDKRIERLGSLSL